MLQDDRIENIDFETILQVWKSELWPERISEIEPVSCMVFGGGVDPDYLKAEPEFWAYYVKDQIIGVNSGHPTDNGYRSRGLWVHPDYRRQGIGAHLIALTLIRARSLEKNYVWSFPRLEALPVYKAVGLQPVGGIRASGDAFPGVKNVYAIKTL